MIAVARDGETLDALAWRVLGRTAGIVEAAFAANPGIADLGAKLPGGTRVDFTLPAQETAQAPRRETVSLWD